MNDLKKVHIAIITQDDFISIPKNIMKLNDLKNIKIIFIVSLNSGGSLVNKKKIFFQGFGLLQSLKMGIVILWNMILDKLDTLMRISILKNPRSLYAAAYRCGAKHKLIKDPNEQKFLNELKGKKIDLIVSFSAPIIFKKNLLNIPKYGCINLHCSLLPNFAGLLPSFWTLYQNEKEIGATVHFMDDKIDNGKILGQVKLPMPIFSTMFRVIQLTKDAGGDLMCDVISKLLETKLEPQPNNIVPENYFSWPSIEQIREFRKRGGRLI